MPDESRRQKPTIQPGGISLSFALGREASKPQTITEMPAFSHEAGDAMLITWLNEKRLPYESMRRINRHHSNRSLNFDLHLLIRDPVYCMSQE
jgi:hypothetical protein